MANTVKVNLPNRPQGSMIEVVGLGAFTNGETTELTDDQVRLYKARNPDHEGDIEFEFPAPPVEAEEKTGSETTETSDSDSSEPETTTGNSGTVRVTMPLEEGE